MIRAMLSKKEKHNYGTTCRCGHQEYISESNMNTYSRSILDREKTETNTSQRPTYVPVKAEPHTPPYKIHKYFARRPWNVFNQLVNNFSSRGDIILDPFCGGGVTVYEGLKHNRKIIGCDLNPLSIFVVKDIVLSNENRIKNGVYKCSNLKCLSNKKGGGGIEARLCERSGTKHLSNIGHSSQGEKIVQSFDKTDENTQKKH